MNEKLPIPCERCHASGLIAGLECEECRGNGYRLSFDGRTAPTRDVRSAVPRDPISQSDGRGDHLIGSVHSGGQGGCGPHPDVRTDKQLRFS